MTALSVDLEAGQASLRRMARLLVLLDAAGQAGLAPIRILPLHAFAYLTNVLAPVWDMPAQDGRVLKRKGGPFYPDLQSDLDRLVGMGMVTITAISHVLGQDERWRLEGCYRLNSDMAERALRFLLGLADEQQFSAFVVELAFAISALPREELDRALVEDATYSDPAISENNVLDFAEWASRNPSANAAGYFEQLTPPGTWGVSPGEKLHLYVRHLHRRVHAG